MRMTIVADPGVAIVDDGAAARDASRGEVDS